MLFAQCISILFTVISFIYLLCSHFSYIANLPPNLSKSQVSSVRKNLKVCYPPLDTWDILNLQKTFRRRPRRFICLFDLQPFSWGLLFWCSVIVKLILWSVIIQQLCFSPFGVIYVIWIILALSKMPAVLQFFELWGRLLGSLTSFKFFCTIVIRETGIKETAIRETAVPKWEMKYRNMLDITP